MTLRDMIWRHEGGPLQGYKDSRGIWTIGIGHNIQDGPPIKQAVLLEIFDDDLRYFQEQMIENFPWVKSLDMPRVAVLMDMLFAMGINRLRGFKKMLAAMADHNWPDAAKELRDSDFWRSETHNRAEELARQLESGEWTQ